MPRLPSLASLRLRRLAVEARDGEEKAFVRLYRELHPRVSAFVRRRIRSDAEAQEIISNVFTVMVERLPAFRSDKGDVVAWILTIARNQVVDRLRAAGRSQLGPWLDELPDRGDDPEESVVRRSRQDRLTQALAELPDDTRSIVMLRYGDGLRHAQIAEIVGLPAATVRQRLSRAVKSLGRRLREDIDSNSRMTPEGASYDVP